MSFIKNLIDGITESVPVTRFYGRIPSGNVLDENVTSEIIEAGNSYFEIRLSEMFLRDKRHYWAGYIPFAVVVTEFTGDDEMMNVQRRSLPFIVGNQVLDSIEKYIENEHVEYRNTTVAGPIPYFGDKVDIFVGLWRVKVTNLTEKLFGFLGNLVSTFGLSGLSPYLQGAQVLSSGLGALLGIKEMEYRLGTRDEFTDNENDPNQFREGYLAFVNCPEISLQAADLWVKDHRLYFDNQEDKKVRFQQNDYCLIRIDKRLTRNYESLPFHKIWKQAKQLIWHDNIAEADALLMYLAREVAISPDLTNEHRFKVQLLYEANYEKEIERHNIIKEKRRREKPQATRGVRTGLTAKGSMEKLASMAERAGLSRKTRNGIQEIGRLWNAIPYMSERADDFELTDEVINQQLLALSTLPSVRREDAKELARALAIVTVSPS